MLIKRVSRYFGIQIIGYLNEKIIDKPFRIISKTIYICRCAIYAFLNETINRSANPTNSW